MIKEIIFDWGGALAPCDNEIAVVRLKKNFEFDENAFVEYFNEHEDDFCHTNECEEFLSALSNKFYIPIDSIVHALNAGHPDEDFAIAKKLSEKYKIHLLSNQLKFRADHIKKTYDLSFFDKVFFSNDIGLKKPSEEIFIFLLKKINQKPENCLFIDDCPKNIETAKKLGINTILFTGLEQFIKELHDFGVGVE